MKATETPSPVFAILRIAKAGKGLYCEVISDIKRNQRLNQGKQAKPERRPR